MAGPLVFAPTVIRRLLDREMQGRSRYKSAADLKVEISKALFNSLGSKFCNMGFSKMYFTNAGVCRTKLLSGRVFHRRKLFVLSG